MIYRERKQVVVFVIALAMVVGFIVLRYLPLHKEMAALEQRRQAEAAAVTQMVTEAGQLPSLMKQVSSLKVKVGDYDARVPVNRDLGAFLQNLANLMNEHNLHEQLINPGTAVEADGLNCVPVSMQCSGKLEQIYAFFGSLEKLERLIRIERVRLVNDENFGGLVKMETTAVIYYRTQAGQV